MPRAVPVVACLVAASVLVACAVRSGIPGAPAVERLVDAAVPHAPNVVSLHGRVENVKSHRFILRTHDGRIGVELSSQTVVRGRLRAGAYAQVVGRGERPDRAGYVAVWQARPAAVSVSGRIETSNALGFFLGRSGSSATTIVVLSSSTKTPSALPVGDEVTVEGFGSAARGIVATRVSLDAATPSPSPSAAPTPTAIPTPTPTPTAAPTPPRGISLYDGEVVGTDNLFTPPDSDAPSGGQSQTVDGIPCAPTMTVNAYHVHVYLGLYVNGRQVAIPDQIGLYQPGPASNGFTNTATCFYYIHTHDASGKIHIESPSTALKSSSMFALQNVLDVWGMTVNSNGVGPFQGPVRVFIGRAKYGTQYVYPSSYSEYFGDPNAIALYSHMAIWLEVGAPYVTTPPEINFETEY